MSSEEGILRLALVGDIALGNHPKMPGFGFYSRYHKGLPIIMAKKVLPPRLSPDIVFGNLEFVLARDNDHPGMDSSCIGVESFVPFLKQSGFTVLNVANNHSLDYGENKFIESVKSIQENGIKVVGVPEDFDPAGYIRVKGKVIAFVGCTAHPRQLGEDQTCYNIYDRGFLEKIQTAKKTADLVCVSVHWGEEFIPIPSPWEQKTGRAMIDAGAGIVVGHHPHVLREVEKFKNGIIAYSLGNFIGDMTWNRSTRETGCLMVESNGSAILDNKFYPAIIGPDFFPDYFPLARHAQCLSTQAQRYGNWKMALKKKNYKSLSGKAMRENQWLTLLFFLRNLFKYKSGTLKEIIVHGISVRFSRSK